MRGFMGGLYRLTEWVMRLSFINLLWLVCSLFIPLLVLIGLYTIDLSQMQEGLYFWTFVFIGIIAPFTMFPATSAMFTIVRKFVQGMDDAPIFRTFFTGFKENYVKSMLGGIMFAVIYFIIYFNYKFYSSIDGGLQTLSVVFLVFTVLVLITMFHFFNFIVHLDLKFGRLLKNAMLMTIGSPVVSLAMLIVNSFILYVSFFQVTFLVPFFTGSLMAFSTYWLYQRSFDRIMVKAEALQSKEKESAESSGPEQQERNDSKH